MCFKYICLIWNSLKIIWRRSKHVEVFVDSTWKFGFDGCTFVGIVYYIVLSTHNERGTDSQFGHTADSLLRHTTDSQLGHTADSQLGHTTDIQLGHTSDIQLGHTADSHLDNWQLVGTHNWQSVGTHSWHSAKAVWS
jgi:hypothetical protein